MKSFLILFAALFLVATINAQDKPELNVKFGGTVQGMASYSQNNTDTAQIGFGLRRVRVKMYGTYGDFLKSFVQFELTSPKLLDARIEYIVSKAFQVRVGRFIGAGVRAGGLTPHTDIDIVERPASAIMWGRETIGADYRDYGVAFLGGVDGFNYNLTFHNGDGALNIKGSHFGLASMQTKSLAVSGMVFYKPAQLKGFEVGGYYGMGNKYVNEYSSYNAYVYFEPLPYRLKAEIISVTDKNGPADITGMGYYVFGAFRFANNFEALARFENLDPNTDLDNDKQTLITIGLAYSFFPESWKTAKITGAYVIRQEEGTSIDNDVFYLMFQAAL
jgi:hypothetical protein